MPDVTAEQFDAKFQEIGSLYGMAKHYKISNTRLYQLAHRLFPGRQWTTGPGRMFVVTNEGPIDGTATLYRIQRADSPDSERVAVHWNHVEQAAYCQLCLSLRRPFSSSCVHARSVRRYVMEGRTEDKALTPCPQCPWTQPGQPDLTQQLREAAKHGKWFCCHINLGTCIGAANYGRSVNGRR